MAGRTSASAPNGAKRVAPTTGNTGSSTAVAAGDAASTVAAGSSAGLPGQRRTPVPKRIPERVPALMHLTLPALRSYRRQLATEEGRVSYWRRILQARRDVLAKGDSTPMAVDRLGEVLGEARSSRLVLMDVGLHDELPPLPDLAGLWSQVDPSDDDARDALVDRLTHAETVLSSYRAALHRRQDLATRELIARYHEDPSSCLIALPRKGR